MIENKQPKKSDGVSESKICRDIIDRHNVMASQVFALIVEGVGAKLGHDDLTSLQRQLEGSFTKHTNGLIDQVSKRFAGK